MTYAIFLRGINVGGNKKVPMADLKKVFESIGMQNVRTLLNSGNVVFESSEKDAEKLSRKLEKAFEEKFGFDSAMQAVPAETIEKMVAKEPFKGVKADKNTLLYVTFVQGKPPLFNIVRRDAKTTDMMMALQKKHGKNITTRNWNTVVRVHALLY